ncbi:MAG: GAF domain-containing sensor histidine kinase [Armatimonadota bacterium]
MDPEKENITERMQKLEKLQEITLFLSSTLDLNNLIERIIKTAKLNLNVEDSSLMLLDEEKMELYFRYIDPENMSEEQCRSLRSIRLKIGEGIGGFVAKTGEPLIISDVQHDPRFSVKGDKSTGKITQNMLCVPIKYNKNIIGVLELINKKDGNFTETDVSDSQALANIAGVAIQNANLHEKTLKSLNRITELEESKTKFTSIISHELNTPLTAVRGYADLFSEEIDGIPPETAKEYLDTIIRESSRLAVLINDIFIINDIDCIQEQMSLKEHNIPEIVNKTVEKFKENCPGRKITVSAGKEDIKAVIDSDKIAHCLEHLLDNAVKFSGEDTVINVNIEKKDNFIEITVEDKGCGIPENEQKNIFNKFYQVDMCSTRCFEGIGNGLFICKKLVEAHRGEITCKSTPDVGSRFLLKFPAER